MLKKIVTQGRGTVRSDPPKRDGGRGGSRSLQPREYSLELSIVATYEISLTCGTLCALRALGLFGYIDKWKTVAQPSHTQYFPFKQSPDPIVKVILMPEVEARTGTPQLLSIGPYPAYAYSQPHWLPSSTIVFLQSCQGENLYIRTVKC